MEIRTMYTIIDVSLYCLASFAGAAIAFYLLGIYHGAQTRRRQEKEE